MDGYIDGVGDIDKNDYFDYHDDDEENGTSIFLCHLDLDLDDRHRNPNINIREIIWLGD